VKGETAAVGEGEDKERDEVNILDLKYLKEESDEIQRRGKNLQQVRNQHKENLLNALGKADKKNGEAGVLADLLLKLKGK